MSFLPLDGPAVQTKISVTTSTVVEMKADTNILEDRKVITFQPLLYYIYVYWGDEDVVPNSTTVSENGFEYPPGLYTIEVGNRQHVYMLAKTSTTNVVLVERG